MARILAGLGAVAVLAIPALIVTPWDGGEAGWDAGPVALAFGFVAVALAVFGLVAVAVRGDQ